MGQREPGGWGQVAAPGGGEPLVLSLRLPPGPGEDAPGADPLLVLELSADGRTRLRGHRTSRCGRDLLLQLPRGAALDPGEWLAGTDGRPRVRVEAASEPLLLVNGDDPLALLRAAYHLGNRHVALQVAKDGLRLLEDPVLADLLRQLPGLRLERRREPFLPEAGAYGTAHGHTHGHSHAPAAALPAPRP